MVGMLGARNGPFGRVTHFDIAEPVGEHAHPHVHLLFKVSGADRTMIVAGEAATLTDTNCVLINPWQQHRDAHVAGVQSTLMLAFYLDTRWLRATVGGAWRQSFARRLAAVSEEATALVRAIGDELAHNTAADVSPTLEAMIVDLIRDVCDQEDSEVNDGPAFDYRIRQAIQLLEESPHLHPDFRSVARHVGLSRSRFYEQFRNSTGVAPNMFMDALVMEEAISMLAFSDKRLEEISSRLGFSAQSSFTRFFKERVGFPPSTLRRAVEFRAA